MKKRSYYQQLKKNFNVKKRKARYMRKTAARFLRDGNKSYRENIIGE